MFKWDQSLSTGLRGIDVQHKMLIDALNELEEAIEKGQGSRAVSRVLIFLQFYAGWHFEREEKAMAKYRCPASDANKQAHAKFVVRFGQLFDQYRQSGASNAVAEEARAELADWLVNHIRGVDTQLVDYIPPGSN